MDVTKKIIVTTDKVQGEAMSAPLMIRNLINA